MSAYRAAMNSTRPIRALRPLLIGITFAGATAIEAASYQVSVSSWTTFHTRAHTRDTLYISIAGSVLKANDFRESLDWMPARQGCKGLVTQQAPICATSDMGDFENGVHHTPGRKAIVYGVNQGAYPIASYYLDAPPSANQSLLIAIAIFNYGSPQLVLDPSDDLVGPLLSALDPMLLGTTPFGPVSLTKSLNHHRWQGCDGPVLGVAYRLSAADLARLTASGALMLTVAPQKVNSQVGCGASSKYGATIDIRRVNN